MESICWSKAMSPESAAKRLSGKEEGQVGKIGSDSLHPLLIPFYPNGQKRVNGLLWENKKSVECSRTLEIRRKEPQKRKFSLG